MRLRALVAEYRDTVGAALVLFLLPYLLFWQVWLPVAGQPLLFEPGDFVEQNVAMRQFVAGEFREGRLPMWDPYTYGGQPALSASLFAPFYPLGWWQVIFPFPFPDWVLPVEVIFHLGIGGFGTFLFLQRLTDNKWAGLVAGLTFQFSGWITGYPMLQVGIVETAVWLPWGLWLIERGMAQQSWRHFAGVALVYGTALLAGHPQTLMYMAYLSAVFYIYCAVRYHRDMWFILGGGGIVVVGVLGVGAAQWLPAVEAYQYSPRLDLDYSEVGNGFQWRELAGVLIPDGEEWSPLFVGYFPLLAAMTALFRARRNELYFWALVAAIALMLSLGSNGWLYPLAYRVLPGFAVFRNQERIALLYMAAIVVLSGYGWHYWSVQLSRNRTQQQLFQWTVPVLVVIALSTSNFTKVLTPDAQGYYPSTPLVDYLHSVGDPTWRISSEGRLPDGPNAGMVYRLRDVVGNSPLHLAALDEFLTVVPELRWWQLLNIQHVLTERVIPENSPVVPVLHTERGTLYQVFVNAKPVWITHQYEAVDSQSFAIRRTADSTVDPSQTVILEKQPTVVPRSAVGAEHVMVTQFDHQRLVTEVSLSAPAIVVWSEIAYPGWVVRVNGIEAEPLRAYGLLRAVALPGGDQTIEWRFEPPLVNRGIGISLSTIALGLIATGWKRKPTAGN